MNKNIQNRGSENTPSTGFLRNLSIKKKLLLIIMLVSSVGLLLAGGSFITYEWFSLRKRMINDLNTQSEIIADNCTGSLSFDDPQDAEEVLGSLQHNHPIEYACVYRRDGALFAAYKREDANAIISSGPQQDGCRFEDGRLILFKQIILNNKPIGTLYLQSDLSLISKFLTESIIALAIVILLSSIIAYLLASRLQRVVSTPVFYLAKIAGIITQKGDYSVRAMKHSKDELGVLTDAFNNMLIQVEKREISLKESEERFRAIFEQAAVGVAQIISSTGRFVRINQRYCDIVGYTQEEMTTTTFMAITHPDDLQIDLDNMQKLIKGEIHKFSMEKRYYHKDGSIVWVNRTVSSMLNVGEESDYHIAVVEDITERKRAEDALQSLATTFSTITGEEFFNKVSAHLATTLDMDYAFVGELIEKEDKVKVLGGFGKGQKLEPFEYDLADTPCENVMGQSLCCYLQGVSEQFPKDLLLVEMGIEGYIGAPLFYKSGEALGIMVVLNCKPITSQKITENLFNIFDDRITAEIERRQAEEALLQEKAFTDVMINSLPGIFYVYNEDQYLIKWNKNHETITDYSSEELSQMHILDWVGDEEKKRLAAEVETVFKEGEITTEHNLITKEGMKVPLFCTGKLLKSGNKNYLIGMGIDITDIKKAEEALQESERRYRTLFERSADAVLIIEGNNFVDCNSATVKMLGYKNKKELLNVHPSQLSPPLQPDGQDSFEKANQMMAIAFDQGSNRFEWDHQRKNGKVFPVEVLLTSIPFKEGYFLHVVWRDITERKQAEKELENYREHLEKLVNERTLELEKVHAELVRKERLATLGELIATVSHEIRNPLGTIRNAVYSIGEGIGKNKMDLVNRALKLAESNITRCNRIINELLDYSRKREIKLERTEIDSWLNGVLDEHEFPEDIECVRKLHSGIILLIDREYIRRVVFNVITNAIQALQEEGSRGNRITVESVRSGECLELRFIDTGPGIPDEIKEKIFEPLFSTRSFGVGLGVPIIKNIMEEHQGEVKFQSEGDKGTVVTLTLPIHKLEKKR